MACAVALVFPPSEISDLELACYLSGKTLAETAAAVCAAAALPASGDAGAFVAREVADNAAALAAAEAALGDPRALLSGAGAPALGLALRPAGARRFIAAAYAPVPAVARSLLGRLLTSRVRARLDLVAERAGVAPRAAARTFDCLRRAVDRCVDADWRLAVLPMLASRLALPPRLAWQYACLLLLLRARVTVCADTRLDALPLAALEDVAGAMLLMWAPAGLADAAPADAPYVAALRALRSAGAGAGAGASGGDETPLGLGLDAAGFLAPLRAFVDGRRPPAAAAELAAAAAAAAAAHRDAASLPPISACRELPGSALSPPPLPSDAAAAGAGADAAAAGARALDGKLLATTVAALASLCADLSEVSSGVWFSRVFDLVVLPLKGAGLGRGQAAAALSALGAAGALLAAPGGAAAPPTAAQADAWLRFCAVVEITCDVLWRHTLD